MFSSNATQVSAVTQAEAVDFDGTNDYLSRASDLTGNTNGQAFTFSAWLWKKADGTLFALYDSDNSGFFGIRIQLNASNQITIQANNASNTLILSATATSPLLGAIQTFVNVLISINLASTSNRSVYVNDVAATVTWTTYTNQTIGRIRNRHGVGNAQGGDLYAGRLSNVFLDYTYRDMSVTANRRLFVTADLKPAAGQAALNPILYLPMSDPTTVATNSGTGGNFTLTGTVARSGRGPNQYNAPYSQLNGSADYLSRTTAPTGIADGKTFTLQCVLSSEQTGADYDVVSFSSSTTYKFRLYIVSAAYFKIVAYNASNTEILNIEFGSVTTNRNYVITVSVDLSNTSNRRVYVNGSVPTVLFWNTYTNDNIDFGITSTPRYNIGATSANAASFPGKLGALYFNTSYIDLSVASNLAKFVSGTGIDAKPVDLGATGELPTGTAPLIYLPMYGNNAGKNYGTGGDFTVNSGPYTGARGPNEFWGNKATFNGTTGRLTKSAALTGVSAGKIFSASYFVTFAASATNQSMMHIANSGNSRLSVFRNTSNQLTLSGRNTSNTEILVATVTSPTIAAGSYSIQIVVDLANSANRAIYINGAAATVTWSTYTNGDIALASNTVNLGVADTGSYIYYLNGSLSEFYFTTEYIDFTQEANRLKFRDCFGNPTDLPSAITALSVPNPAIYMRFPPTSFGTNSGTGGDFTVNGTITDGGQL